MTKLPLARLPVPHAIRLVLAVAGLGAALGAPLGAGATSTYCRTDPSLVLSNGATLTLYEDVYDTTSDITGIVYQVHLPVGVSITSITYTGAVPATAQTITVTNDENPGNYDAYTKVTTKSAAISVTAYMSGTSGGTTTVSCHTNGHSGQLLHSHLHF